MPRLVDLYTSEYKSFCKTITTNEYAALHRSSVYKNRTVYDDLVNTRIENVYRGVFDIRVE